MTIDVLFIDDEPMLLTGLRRALRSMAPQWTVRFADSGASALDQLLRRPADVVVSDIRMPGMDGLELLSRVRDQYPGTLRVALSGHNELEHVLAAVAVTHRFLYKPCDVQLLQATVTQLLEINQRINSPRMQAFVTRSGDLPASPAVVDRLNIVLLDPAALPAAIIDALSADPAITARLLELANSVLTGASHPACDLPGAISVLGPQLIRDLAAATAAREAFATNSPTLSAMAAELVNHSLPVARLAMQLAGEHLTGPAYSAGILHDIGLLVLAAQAPHDWARVNGLLAAGTDRITAEMTVLGITHAEIGSHLLAYWGLPTNLCEAVAWHHDAPTHGPWTMNPTHAVYLAETLLTRPDGHHATSLDTGADVLGQLDPAYLRALDMPDRLAMLAQTTQTTQTATG